MTQAITALQDGFRFQARLFWQHAARLLDAESPVIKMGFERGPKSFDDIWVEYDPARAPNDHLGNPMCRIHMQCKWHSEPFTFGFHNLTEPSFINAEKHSFLHRARIAQLAHAPEGIGSQFRLISNWRLAIDDPLRSMISKRSTALRVERLFATTRDSSKAGQIRKSWREHLEIDDLELRRFAQTIAIGEATDSLDDMRGLLDMTFRAVGLRRVPVHETSFFYDDLVYGWMAQQRQEFDRQSFGDMCRKEGLLTTAAPPPKLYGIKSFQHAFDQLEERCVKVLDLLPFFEERFIRSEADWSARLYPELRQFLLEAAGQSERLALAVEAHASLAFAAGSILDIKSGRKVDLEQRSPIREIWSADDKVPDGAWPRFSFRTETLETGSADFAVAVGVTHDIGDAVRAYVLEEGLAGQLLIAALPGRTGSQSLTCGRHALDLAGSLADEIAQKKRTTKAPMVHLFVSGPNAFTFFLGQRARQMGPVRLYEYDFEGGRSGSYAPSLTLPIFVPTAQASD